VHDPLPDCTFCGKKLFVSALKNIAKSGIAYNVSECSECEIAITHPFPSEEELTRLYACGNYRTNKGKRFGPIIESLILLGRILKRGNINKYVKPGKILDIGRTRIIP